MIQKHKYAIITGYASTFNCIDKSHHSILPTAFSYDNFNKHIPVLLQHDFRKEIGAILNVKINTHGLYIEAALNLIMPTQQKAFADIKNFSTRGMSVGMKILKSRLHNGILLIEKAQLQEVSITSNPVNTHCYVEFCEEFYN